MLMISFFLLCLFEKKIRKNFILVFVIFLIGFNFLNLESNVYRHHYKKFIKQSTIVVQYLKNKIITGNIVAPDECRNRDLIKSNQYNDELKKIWVKCSNYLNVYIKEIIVVFKLGKRINFLGAD